MDLESVVAWVLRADCPDCFHAECLERCDLVEDLRRMEGEHSNGSLSSLVR